jgi:hypothetical protein
MALPLPEPLLWRPFESNKFTGDDAGADDDAEDGCEDECEDETAAAETESVAASIITSNP